LEQNDAVVTAAIESVRSQIAAAAKKQGLLNDYIYLNYAMPDQDPISSYGAANVANLRIQSRLFDPKQVFQRLVPGGFKLYG